jgi:hypothetical protein
LREAVPIIADAARTGKRAFRVMSYAVGTLLSRDKSAYAGSEV